MAVKTVDIRKIVKNMRKTARSRETLSSKFDALCATVKNDEHEALFSGSPDSLIDE